MPSAANWRPVKPLGTKQIVQGWIAESRAEIHAARLMVLHAAWKIEKQGVYDAREEISLIKFTVARTLQRGCSTAPCRRSAAWA